MSIWNFHGRAGGGYFSEFVVRNYICIPRPVSIALVQVIMAIGLFYYAMAWPGAIYVVTVLIGLDYGAYWAIVPAAVSELFGLKSFGALYNFLTLSSTVGSLIFSGIIASGIYDYEAENQTALRMLSINPILGDDESLTCTGTICYNHLWYTVSAVYFRTSVKHGSCSPDEECVHTALHKVTQLKWHSQE